MSVEQNVALNNELYQNITLEEVNALSRQLVTDKNMIIAVSAPEKEGLIIPESAELLALLDMVKKSAITPYLDATTDEPLLGKLPPAGKIKSEKNYPALGIKVWTLSNGVKVYTKQTDFKNDEVSIRAFSPGGTSLYSLADLFEAREAASVVAESGVGSFTSSALEKKLSGKLLSLDPYISATDEGLRGNSSKADLETLMQLIWLYSTSPKVDKDSFASWKSRTRAYMENEVLDPEKAYNDSTQALIYNHHPRSKDMSALDLEALDMNRIIQIYQERFGNAADFSYIIVGNFDEKILRSLCEKYLAALPSTGKQEKVTDTGIRYTKGKHDLKVYKGQDQKSTVQYIISGTAKYSSQTRSELYNLTYLLNEKLRENIRETRSGVYFVGAWPQLKQYPVPTYQITIYMQCAPERVEELSAAIISTLDSLKTGSIDAKYVNAVKMTRTKKLETDKKENQWWMNNIYEQAWNKQPLAGMLVDEQVINKMSIRSLQKSTAKYLMHDKNLLRSVLLPEDWKDK
jgi:zinc protease